VGWEVGWGGRWEGREGGREGGMDGGKGGREGGGAGLLDVNWRGSFCPILVFDPMSPPSHTTPLRPALPWCPSPLHTHVLSFASSPVPIPPPSLSQACVRGAGHTYCRIDGTSSLEERRGQVEAFQAPRSNIQVFLLTSQVRGWCGFAWGAHSIMEVSQSPRLPVCTA
jgi:hypothetical protein